MTVVAGIVGRHMGSGFTGCRGAVVTAETAADHGCVVDPCYRCPATGSVTIRAEISGRDVPGSFTRRGNAIVATGAIATDIAVIEYSRGPTASVVTIVAGIAADDVSWRLAGRDAAVVAGGAGP